MKKTQIIVESAQRCANLIPNFCVPLGAGRGNDATNHFMKTLRERLHHVLGNADVEKKILPESNSAVDFYIPEEETIIEIALSLKNPNSEFFKDVLKALIAKDIYGWNVKKLIFISKRGSPDRYKRPLYKAIKDWVYEKHDIEVEFKELGSRK